MGIIQPVIGLDALAKVLMSKQFTAEVRLCIFVASCPSLCASTTGVSHSKAFLSFEEGRRHKRIRCLVSYRNEQVPDMNHLQYLQVVVNPFIWSQLATQGHHVPYMFEEFVPRRPQALIRSVGYTDKVSIMSSTEILSSLTEILHTTLGYPVSLAPRHHTMLQRDNL